MTDPKKSLLSSEYCCRFVHCIPFTVTLGDYVDAGSAIKCTLTVGVSVIALVNILFMGTVFVKYCLLDTMPVDVVMSVTYTIPTSPPVITMVVLSPPVAAPLFLIYCNIYNLPVIKICLKSVKILYFW